jgi:hypothetical protein
MQRSQCAHGIHTLEDGQSARCAAGMEQARHTTTQPVRRLLNGTPAVVLQNIELLQLLPLSLRERGRWALEMGGMRSRSGQHASGPSLQELSIVLWHPLTLEFTLCSSAALGSGRQRQLCSLQHSCQSARDIVSGARPVCLREMRLICRPHRSCECLSLTQDGCHFGSLVNLLATSARACLPIWCGNCSNFHWDGVGVIAPPPPPEAVGCPPLHGRYAQCLNQSAMLHVYRCHVTQRMTQRHLPQ